MTFLNNGNKNTNPKKNGKGDMVRIGGLWESSTSSGESYLSGTFGTARILVFQNNFRERDSDPNFVLYMSQGGKNGNTKGQQQRQEEF